MVLELENSEYFKVFIDVLQNGNVQYMISDPKLYMGLLINKFEFI